MTKKELESVLTQVAGAECEITIRGERDFTVSTDEMNVVAGEKIQKFFAGKYKKILIDNDEELGTFVFLTF